MKWPRRNSTFRFLVYSLGLHLMLTLMIYVTSLQKPASTQVVEMEILEKQSMPPLPDQANKESTDKPKKKKVDETTKIVDQEEKPVNDEVDDKAKFLSRNNQKVIKQTIAKNHGEFQNKAEAGPAGEQTERKEPPSPLKKFLPQFDVSKAVQNRDLREHEYDANAERLMADQKKQPAQPTPASQHDGGGTGQAEGKEASQTLDYIHDIDPGLETLLSTKEFKYYTYFSRIRVQLNQHWAPKVRQKVTQIYKSGRRIASSDDMITKCLVTLDQSGKLLRVQIIGNSGLMELDEAAVEAFRAAAPFPNPPKGMVDGDGTIKIRWDFILEA